MTARERHMVTIETERTGAITLTPEQFDLLMECALVGLDGYPGPDTENADFLHGVLTAAYDAH